MAGSNDGPPEVNLPSTPMPNGMEFIDIQVGTGDEAQSGKQVTVHYTGWLTDGKKFDSSRDRRPTVRFSLGAGQVIRGWDTGVAGMHVGGQRRLIIPANLGYGARGAPGAIPPECHPHL